MKLAIIGSALTGGAIQVIDVLLEDNITNEIRVYDDDQSALNTEILGVSVVGSTDRLEADFANHIVDCAIVAVGSIVPRRLLFERFRRVGIPFVNIISSKAVVSRWARLGIGNVVLPMVYIGPKVKMADNNYLTTQVVINHDSVVGSHCYFSTSVSIAGRVRIGDGVRFDTSASVTADAVVPADALIGPAEAFGPVRGR